ncbi:PqiC family protein [Teredinibacter franksiae]|uniref:PqiC family protein n=1 Tax=Teredinibacter franksiae TaxID=2761453 RepID=UPI00162A924C|nr:PqiC family protein [Teredinibacter franksiae]
MNSKALCGSLILLMLLTACVSSGPKTQYYTLYTQVQPETHTPLVGDKLSFGIGPIILPEYLDHPAVVSRTQTQQIRVSGTYAWGGNLKATVGRVLASNLSEYWQQDSVWAFPWDNRARPEYQIRIVFDDFAGVRGGTVSVNARWMLFEQGGKKEIAVGTIQLSGETTDESVEAYVKSLNSLLNAFSVELAKEVAEELSAFQ